MRGMLARALLITALAVCAAVPGALAQDTGVAVLTDIRQESTDNSTRLVVECNGPLAYTYYAPDPLTLVVDVPEVDASALPARIEVGTREVESVRVTSLARGDGRELARLEIRLASVSPYQIYSKDNRLNLVFERAESVAATPAESVAATPVIANAAAPAEAPEAAPVAPSAPEPSRLPEVEVATPEFAPEAPPTQRATRITGVRQEFLGSALAITVEADGRLDYQDFFLGNPDRLVVDFPGVSSPQPRAVPVGRLGVDRVRLAQFSASDPRVARLVLDLNDRSAYEIMDASDGLRIVFGQGAPVGPEPLAAIRPAPVAAAASTPPLVLPEPPALEPPAPARPILITPQAPAAAGEEAIQSRRQEYEGYPISLDFKDGDLIDIFRLFSDITGLNVVINPGVSGKVSLKLTEVPWDQALDLILKTNGLGKTIDGNVLRIARLSDLQREENERRRLEEEKQLAGELDVMRRTLAYAKVGQMQQTVQAVALSPRGTITLDTRTNTMIITDLPAYLEQARELIANLDIPTPQVEIEARIVVTSRNFTRDIGVQWGFSSTQNTTFGNTTNLAFPNSILIDGAAVDSVGGLQPPGGRGYAVNLPASGFNSGLGVSMGNILGNFNLDAALTALERQGRGRLLSTPKITTQNNMAAEIKQGQQIPIQTVANNTVTVSFQDAALTLSVTPQITDADTVILAVDVENNAPDFANLVNGIPPINTQSANTNVLVRDGATAVIGGIYQSQEQSAQQRTPFLSKLPILGLLFKNNFRTSTNNELLIFITPRIIKG